MRIQSSARRVPANTAEHVNRRLRMMTEANIHYYARHPEEIDARLRELDEEWDIERVIQANASGLALGGSLLGLLLNKRWLILPIGVTAFLLQHALQGWCPPVPILRRLGVRTTQEIEAERYALKALRGDFEDVPSGEEGLEQALHAIDRFKR
jgi:hypothetical protein